MKAQPAKKIGIAGMGAIGSAVAKGLMQGIQGCTLSAISDLREIKDLPVPNLDFAGLAANCDFIVEALPAAAIPALATEVFRRHRDLILITSCALILYPEILERQRGTKSRIYVPSGSLCGIDGVKALAQSGIIEARIISTKPPKSFAGAPFFNDNKLDLAALREKTCLFRGNVFEAARSFPANVNVAATLALAGAGPEKTQIEIWADPDTDFNSHEIRASGPFSRITARVENMPDPANPKSSMLAAQSILSILEDMNNALTVL